MYYLCTYLIVLMMKYNGRSNLGMERVLWTPQLEDTILMAAKAWLQELQAAPGLAFTAKQQGLMNALFSSILPVHSAQNSSPRLVSSTVKPRLSIRLASSKQSITGVSRDFSPR